MRALLLTGVRPLVGLQVRALRVDFLAAEELTLVYPSLGVRTVVVVALVMLGRDCGRTNRKHWVEAFSDF